MKKLLPALLLVWIMASCSKTNQTEQSKPAPETAKHKVSFTITDFAATTTTMSVPGTKASTAVGDTLKNYADNLYYRIYDANGNWVNSINQTSATAGFGTITDQLPSGTYTVFMAASKGGLNISANTVPYAKAEFGPSSTGAI